MKFKKNVQPLIYGPEPDPAAGTPPPPAKKTYEQADVDGIVGKTKSELQKKFDEVRRQDLEKMSKLETDAAAKADLEKQIADLNARYKSKEEIAAEQAKKFETERNETFKKLESERDAWRTRLEQQTLLTDLTTAASRKDEKSKLEVHNPSQLVKFLKPDARVVEIIADGKPTGRFETRVKYTDSKGKELDLTPDEVVKVMFEDPNHYNFFKGGVSGGLGTSGGKQGGGNDGLLSMSQEKFTEGYLKGTLPKRT